MKTRHILVPLAAFAVTVTGVSAFNEDVLKDAGLTEAQISAFEEAHELRREGDRESAREVLEDAEIDIDTLESIREAFRAYRDEHKGAVHDAIENNDYDAFKTAVTGLPMEDIITSEDDFAQLVAAHELREDGDHEAARELMEALGFPERGDKPHGHGTHHRHGGERTNT
jgi:uncharacterized protein with PIN domain